MQVKKKWTLRAFRLPHMFPLNVYEIISAMLQSPFSPMELQSSLNDHSPSEYEVAGITSKMEAAVVNSSTI